MEIKFCGNENSHEKNNLTYSCSHFEKKKVKSDCVLDIPSKMQTKYATPSSLQSS